MEVGPLRTELHSTRKEPPWHAPLQITDDTIVKALAAGGEVTAAELADRLGMGQSTAAKRLAALEAAGAVRRTPGGRVNGVRVADRWSSVAPAADTAEPGPYADTDVSATDGTAPVGRRSRRGPAGRAGWAGGRSGPWCATTWPPGRARRSGRVRWARPSAGPRGRCPTRWRRWRRAARWSWSATSPAGTGSPADRRRGPYPAAGNPAGYGLPHFGVRAYPEVG